MSNNLHEDPADSPEVEERRREKSQPSRTSPPRTEQIRQSFPRRHDILWHREAPSRGSHFVAKNLTAFEAFRRLRIAWKSNFLTYEDKPRFEVHFVNEDRELEVMEASEWLKFFKNKVSK